MSSTTPPAQAPTPKRFLPLPPGPFEAYLFDCDGTIADSMPLHYTAWCEAIAPYGGIFTEEDFYAWAGTPTDRIVELLNSKHSMQMPVLEVSEAKEAAYYALMPSVRAVPEVLEHILHAPKGMHLAVVSGSPRESVLKTLTFLGILDRFESIVCAEDYARPKPAPDPFLRAAQALGVAPERCLVFEDAQLGVESAKSAGMSWVFVDPRA